MPDDYRAMGLEQPVCPVRSADGKRALLVTGYHDVRAVLMDEEVSTDKNHPGCPLQNRLLGVGKVPEEKTFFHMDPPDHTRFRRMSAPDFSGKAVAGKLALIQAQVVEAARAPASAISAARS